MTLRILIDTDPAMGTAGGDPEDSFAILLALASPEVRVEGISVVQGNVPVDKAYTNACHLLELIDRRDIPLHAGEALPLSPSLRAAQVEWLRRRGELPQLAPEARPDPNALDAADFLIDRVLSEPGEITLVAIGPLSNIAVAMEREARFADALGGLVIMGGAAQVPGNITPAAEFNIWADPEAAARVFSAGAPLCMVGLDVCEQTHLREASVRALETSSNELGRFVRQTVMPWIELRRKIFGAADLHLYDSLAVAVAFERDLVGTQQAHVAVETAGHYTAGETVVQLNAILRAAGGHADANADVALTVDSDRFEALFQRRVLDPLL